MRPQATVLVGHRGVGKSTLLRQLASPIAGQIGGPEEFFDLDQELQRKTQKKISELWERGEATFRELERTLLLELVNRSAVTGKRVLIAAGAGLDSVPSEAHVVWLRRSSDRSGRIFLDRPRLNPQVSPLQEFLERLPEREARYRKWADEELWLPEGYDSGLEPFFGDRQDWLVPYEMTLLPAHFKNWTVFWNKRKHWGLRHLELRDDLLSAEQIQMVLREVPAEHLIVAHRALSVIPQSLPPKVLSDWALELGPPPTSVQIVSIHERAEDLAAAIRALAAVEQSAHRPMIAKLAVPVRSFAELEQGHRWWLESPSTRAFLPRSYDGRWRWYRSLFGRRMPLHFVREGDGSSLDQPLLWETLHQPPLQHQFAAVLGHPVEHSRSPVEHLPFFSAHGVPIVAIDVAAEEWAQAWPILLQLGLSFAAVTAPLKLKAADVAGQAGPINTLWVRGEQIAGTNTDIVALQGLFDEYKGFGQAWMWGAGAMSDNVAAVFPSVKVMSAREGTQASGQGVELLIWGTGRGREFKWPPNLPHLQLVLDLNYGEDSPGLELAATRNLPYHSGLRMFKLQAESQRHHWRKILG